MLLSIRLMTFNHGNFILQALDSINAQVTNFDFEVVIGDDFSTDDTLSKIKAYQFTNPKISVNILHREKGDAYDLKRQKFGRFHNYFDILSHCRGHYIALLDGDDYWLDHNKLQKQIDFLKSHPDYVVSWTNFNYIEGNKLSESGLNYEQSEVTVNYHSIFSPYNSFTVTTVFRKDALDIKSLYAFNHFKDNTLYMVLLSKGLGIFQNFVSAAYRIHEGGVYSLQSKFFRDYSSYLNLKEIIVIYPVAATNNIQKVINSLGRSAAFELLKLKKTGMTLDESQLSFMEDFFKNADFKTKMKYYKRLIKYRFLK